MAASYTVPGLSPYIFRYADIQRVKAGCAGSPFSTSISVAIDSTRVMCRKPSARSRSVRPPSGPLTIAAVARSRSSSRSNAASASPTGYSKSLSVRRKGGVDLIAIQAELLERVTVGPVLVPRVLGQVCPDALVDRRRAVQPEVLVDAAHRPD